MLLNIEFLQFFAWADKCPGFESGQDQFFFFQAKKNPFKANGLSFVWLLMFC